MVSTEFLQKIWVPDTFFANEKSSYFHMATTSNEFLRISHNGEINRSIRSVMFSLGNLSLMLCAENNQFAIFLLILLIAI